MTEREMDRAVADAIGIPKFDKAKHYSTDPAAAWEVVEKMRADDYYVGIETLPGGATTAPAGLRGGGKEYTAHPTPTHGDPA